jgi:hypothetical protein
MNDLNLLPRRPPAVYGLYDPCTGALRYIGSCLVLRDRAKQHMRPLPHDQSRKAKWIRSLLAAGLRPEVRPLCFGSHYSVREMELRLLWRMRAEGCDLLNRTMRVWDIPVPPECRPGMPHKEHKK